MQGVHRLLNRGAGGQILLAHRRQGFGIGLRVVQAAELPRFLQDVVNFAQKDARRVPALRQGLAYVQPVLVSQRRHFWPPVDAGAAIVPRRAAAVG